MRKRKVIIVLLILISILAIGISYWVESSGKPVLAWRVVDIQSQQNYFAVDRLQPCWRVEIEVSNLTDNEVIVDWHRDTSEFQAAGQWKNLNTSGLLPYLAPNDARSFPLYVPESAQACRLSMYYEDGPWWSSIDGFLRDHNINLPDGVVIPLMNFNKKLPGHFKHLVMQVKLLDTSLK